ncbi:hypothetical protein ACFE04_011617 [Oxalis oulophora]
MGKSSAEKRRLRNIPRPGYKVNHNSNSSDDEDLGVPYHQAWLLDDQGHAVFDAEAKSCLQLYHQLNQNARFEFVELNAVRTQLFPNEYYYTFKARNCIDHSLHTFQAKRINNEAVECKISDVPYVDIPADQKPLGRVLGKTVTIQTNDLKLASKKLNSGTSKNLIC